MKPGRELDALIAEKVFGLPQSTWRDGEDHRDEDGVGVVVLGVRPDPYSTDIAAAWTVVEKLDLLRNHSFERSPDGLYEIGVLYSDDGYWEVYGSAPTAPHAICLAALKAVGV